MKRLIESRGAACDMAALLKVEPKASAIRSCEQRRWPPVVFPADSRSDTIAGTPVDLVTPVGNFLGKLGRITVNLHRGGLLIGVHFHGLAESIPLAAVGGYTVSSVDYRQAPDYHYPAATIDAVKVYWELLNRYKPTAIGIYGCSAWAVLTGQVVAQIQQGDLPLPGAIALNCAAPTSRMGDSQALNDFMTNGARKLYAEYMRSASVADPLAYPADFDDVLKNFRQHYL